MDGDQKMIEHFGKIIKTITIVVIFLLIGLIVGIYLGFAFFEGKPSWQNLVFYIVYVFLFVVALKRIRRIWGL